MQKINGRTAAVIIADIFAAPIKRRSRFLVLMTLITLLPAITNLFFLVISDGFDFKQIKNVADLSMRVIVQIYLCAMVYSLLMSASQKAGKLFACISVLLAAFFSIVDTVCYAAFNYPFINSFPAMILGSNPDETKDFFQFYFNNSVILRIILSIVVSVVVIICSDRMVNNIHNGPHCKSYRVFNLCLSVIVVCSVIRSLTSYYPGGLFKSDGGFYEKVTFIPLFFERVPDLDPENPKLSISGQSRPDCIVLIIGESFARSHSSLYGYEIETNPRLANLAADTSLFIFNNVHSPETHTVPTFKHLMSTFHGGDNEKYFKCATLPGIMSKSGYKTAWFSNQSRRGYYENVITQYAELCDTAIFVGNTISTGHDRIDNISYDERLIAPLRFYAHSPSTFYVIHMMGSHFDFNNRYPKDRQRFDSSLYDSRKYGERECELMKNYDNSIAYNDSVVCSIIDLFSGRESIVIYFPDHGLDCFDSGNKQMGHVLTGDTESVEIAKQIPMVIYVSDSFKANFPELTARIKRSVNRKFNTTDLIYTIMDVIGVRFSENNDVADKSLFREYFTEGV